MKAAELRTLAALAEARRTRDLARLETLLAEVRGLETEIAGLAGVEAQDVAEAPVDFSLIGRRLVWAEAAIAALRRRIAALSPEIAEARTAGQVSLGKHEVLKSLLARAEQDEAAHRDRAEAEALIALPRRES